MTALPKGLKRCRCGEAFEIDASLNCGFQVRAWLNDAPFLFANDRLPCLIWQGNSILFLNENYFILKDIANFC